MVDNFLTLKLLFIIRLTIWKDWFREDKTKNSKVGPEIHRLDQNNQRVEEFDRIDKFSMKFGCMDVECCRLMIDEDQTTEKSLNPKFIVDMILDNKFDLTDSERSFLYETENDDQDVKFDNETIATFLSQIES